MDFRSLDIPPNAHRHADAQEILRVWTAGDAVHVSLSPKMDVAGHWGILLIDVARHASRMLESEGVCSQWEALREIDNLWRLEFSEPTDLGTTSKMGAN